MTSSFWRIACLGLVVLAACGDDSADASAGSGGGSTATSSSVDSSAATGGADVVSVGRGAGGAGGSGDGGGGGDVGGAGDVGGSGAGGSSGQGGGADVGCGAAAVGTWLLAVSVALDQDAPFYFEATVTEESDGLAFALVPVATPYIDAGVEPFTPVGDAIAIDSVSFDEDGALHIETPEVDIPADANPITGAPIRVALVFDGTACPVGPGEPTGTFCGTISGSVTSPITYELDPDRNSFAFSTEAPGALDCAGTPPGPYPD